MFQCGSNILPNNKNPVLQNRAVGGLTEEKLKYAHETEHISSLTEVVKTIKPTAIIGKNMMLDNIFKNAPVGKIV